jgi:hypothetical protein
MVTKVLFIFSNEGYFVNIQLSNTPQDTNAT